MKYVVFMIRTFELTSDAKVQPAFTCTLDEKIDLLLHPGVNRYAKTTFAQIYSPVCTNLHRICAEQIWSKSMFSSSGREGNRFLLFSLSRVDHAPRPILYVPIGQNMTGEFIRKINAASGNLLTEFCVISWCFKIFFHLLYKMKYSCYQDCSVIHGWLVYCAFCWQMHRLSKSLEIRFRWHRFQKRGYSLALAWGVKA